MTILIVVIFILGYAAIAFEQTIKINKTAPALIAGVLCWTVYILFSENKELLSGQLMENLGEFSGILFFLMGAMTIVEIIDLHDGFHIITKKITVSSKRKLLWIISGITFLLSPVLDNLTTTIVMVSLLQKIINDPKGTTVFCFYDRNRGQCRRRMVANWRCNNNNVVDRWANHCHKYN